MKEQMKPLHWKEVAADKDRADLPFLKYFQGGLPETTPDETRGQTYLRLVGEEQIL